MYWEWCLVSLVFACTSWGHTLLYQAGFGPTDSADGRMWQGCPGVEQGRRPLEAARTSFRLIL